MHLPAFLPRQFPAPLARIITKLPPWPPSRAFAVACNLAAWPTLRELDWAHVRGRRFRVAVKDMGLRLNFSIRADGFRAERDGPVDVTFTATAQDLARLALRLEDPDTLFFDRRLLIEGDTDLGLTVKNMLDSVELEAIISHMPSPMGRMVMGLRRLAEDGKTEQDSHTAAPMGA